jgi:hypothetical protein
MLVVARRVSISIENIARPFTNVVGVQPLAGIAVRLRAEGSIISNIEPTPNAVNVRAEGPP